MDTFVTRQPVIDPSQRTYAYRLRHRTGLTGSGNGRDEASLMKLLADLAMLVDVPGGTPEARAMVTMSRDAMILDFAELLPVDQTILEIPVSIEVDDVIVDRVRALREMGYRIALCDVIDDPASHPLLRFADMLCVPIPDVPSAERASLAAALRRLDRTLVAFDVPNWRFWKAAMQLGFEFGSGPFWNQPVVLVGKDIDGARATYLQILMEINEPEIDFSSVELIIARDASLGYKLLKYMNSAFHGIRAEVTSINHAVVLLGERELKRWVSLVVLTSIAPEAPGELLIQASLRGRLCELLAGSAGMEDRAAEAFFLGMLSALDAILECPMASLVAQLPLSKDIRGGLLGGEPPLGPLLTATQAYLAADWAAVSDTCHAVGIASGQVPTLYKMACDWSAKCFEKADATAA